jgi:hypothetical protein
MDRGTEREVAFWGKFKVAQYLQEHCRRVEIAAETARQAKSLRVTFVLRHYRSAQLDTFRTTARKIRVFRHDGVTAAMTLKPALLS